MAKEVEKYVVPAGDGVSSPLVFPMVDVVRAMGRLDELAFANYYKAQELSTTLNRAWLQLKKYHTQLSYERIKAEERVKDARSDTLLELTDAAMKVRGFSKSNAELREAIVQKDDRYREARKCYNQINAAVEFLGGKLKALENGYRQAQKIMGAGTNGLPPRRINNEDAPDETRSLPGFGNAK